MIGMTWTGNSRFFGVFALAFAALTIAPGCGGGGGNDGGNGPASLVGSWRAETISAAGTTISCPGSIPFTDNNGVFTDVSCGSDDTVQFKSDGTLLGNGSREGTRGRVRGTWSRNGDTLTTMIAELAVDLNGNGAFEADEVFPQDPPQTTTGRIEFLDSRHLTVHSVEDGVDMRTTSRRL
jgi:hypothetical protein